MLSYSNPNYGPCGGCTSSFSFHTLLSPFLVCVCPVQGHSAGADVMEPKGGGCHGHGPGCAWFSITRWSAGPSSSLTAFAPCPCALAGGCASPLGRRWLRGGGSKALSLHWWKWVLAGSEEAPEEAQGQGRYRARKCGSKVWEPFQDDLVLILLVKD